MMEVFQTIWTALTSPNEVLLAILTFPIYFIDAIVNMLLFTTILNIKTTKKRKVIYVIVWVILGYAIRTFIPDPYGSFTNLITGFILIKLLLQASWLKSIIAEFIVVSITSILELFMFKFYLIAFHISSESILTIPLYRLLTSSSIYLCIFLLYKIIDYCKFHIILENMNKKNKILFFITTALGILAIGSQIYIMAFYSDKMPIGITVVSMFSLLAYFIISMYSLFNTNKLDTTSRNLEQAQLYNKTLILLHDNMRVFKHNFHNIVQALGGYIDRNDIEGLKKYYKQLLEDCNRVNNLTALSPTVINNPAIYNIMASKYHRADENGIQINLTILMDLNEVEQHMKIYEFTRILGILMDNAIEASSECEEKMIHVTFRKEDTRHRILMVIENTYLNKDIDVEKIFEKSFSTKSKKTNSGLGLWDVRQVLKRNNNLNLYTTKDDEYFKQQFEIYY